MSAMPPVDIGEEIAALIATLHSAEQRLDELTSGELDTVADSQGRTFLLRRAQDDLRQSDAEKQAAILNALPAHIALLDAEGVVVSVNESWRRFAAHNALLSPGHAVGLDYIAVCDAASGKDAEGASLAANGIRSVLRSEVATFSLEYACHSPAEQRWFVMTVTPLSEMDLKGAVVMHLDITQRKRAETEFAALSLSTAKRERVLSTTLASIADFAYIFDREGRFLFANRPLLELLKITLAEIVGKTFSELGYPQDLADKLQEQIQQVFETGQSVTDETPFAGPAGEEGFYEYIFSPVIAPDGTVEFVVGSTRDVTERKRGVAVLLESVREQRKLAGALEVETSRLLASQRVAKLGSWETDLVTMSILWSEETHRIYETDPAAFSPTHATFLEFVHPEDRTALNDAFGQSILERTAGSHEFRLLLPGGRAKFVEERWQVLCDEEGIPYRAIGTCQDITERKSGEEALRRFSAAMDATVDAIYLVDRASMNFVHVNDAACRMQGRTREELMAMGPQGVLTMPLADLVKAYDVMIASGLPAEPVEIQRIRRDGLQVWVELRRHAQRSAAGWTIVTLVRDITERKAAERRILYLNRVYSVLSGINTTLVRVSDRNELFSQACRIAVDKGGFVKALICMIDPASARIDPVAWSGMGEEMIAQIRAQLSTDESASRTMIGRAIREKQAIISNLTKDDPQATLRRQHVEFGVGSLAVLPLVVAGEAVGVLALYAGEEEFFHAEEMKLLTELAEDVAFGIHHLEAQGRLEYLAYYDDLTGLANRRLFLERLAQFMRSATAGGHQLALFLIDLERFKNINDSLGRPAGDALLKLVAEWMKTNLGDVNLLARIGADHFAVVLPQVDPSGDPGALLEKWMAAFLAHPFHLEDAVFRISAKVGAGLFPGDGADADTLFRKTEAALKKAKATGERYLFHTQAMTSAVAGSLTLENQLRQAIDRDEFVLHYQPKIELATGKLTGAEALIRWNDPRTGLVPPGRFIPVLEQTGLIYEVGRWALRRAIEDYLRWRAAGLPAVRIAVNVSPLQLRNRDFVAEVGSNVGVDAGAPAGLELEITESLIMEDVKHSIASLKAIREMGVTVAIDDFGTGFSSLSYLARLPVDTLKIDRSFVTDMTVGPDGLSLVSTIINLAHTFRLNVVAEGVETEDEKSLLRLLGCNEMQGFLFSKPVPAADFETRFLAPIAA